MSIGIIYLCIYIIIISVELGARLARKLDGQEQQTVSVGSGLIGFGMIAPLVYWSFKWLTQ